MEAPTVVDGIVVEMAEPPHDNPPFALTQEVAMQINLFLPKDGELLSSEGELRLIAARDIP